MRLIAVLASIFSLIVFAAAAQDIDDLAGTSWQLVSGGGATITLEFGEDGRAGGSSGCNTYGANYTADAGSISFSAAVSTLMACAEDAMAQERDYLAALEAATAYKRDGDRLTITYGDGQQLVFARRAALAGTQWQLQSFDGAPVVEGTTITLEFGGDDQIAGDSGCNRYGAAYTLDGDTISFGAIFSTRRACIIEGSAEQEQAYFAALQTATAYILDGDRLTVVYGDGAELVFARVLALAGTSWQLESLAGAAVSDGLITLEFGRDGRVSGSGGCNRYNGGYAVEGDAITFGQVAATLMACADGGTMEQEAAYFAALASATMFELTAEWLTITYGEGQQLVFVPSVVASTSP
ncbi:MAG: META domain-containing protein [Chloroflexi bacterium]|nr:META domain-containing protein [Chloroflexota bacterium]